MMGFMTPDDIVDGISLDAWLKGRASKDHVSIAQRSALRVAPFWFAGMAEPWAQKADLTTLPVLRQLLTAGVAAVLPSPEISAAAAEAAADTKEIGRAHV